MSKSVQQPCVLVLFGTTGDLAKRKLFAALYDLFRKKRLPAPFRVVGVGRRDWDTNFYQNYVKQSLQEFAKRSKVSSDFLSLFVYERVEFHEKSHFENLKKSLTTLTKSAKIPQNNLLFYYSISPKFFGPVTKHLKACGLVSLSHETIWPRVIFEKPFGTNLSSARKINTLVKQAFSEIQTYRIDHYVAKSAIQNLLVFRFANSIFDRLLNRQHVDHIQLTVAESLGVEERAGFYDQTGALKDMIQSHLLQVLALLLMEPPTTLSANEIHSEKAKLLRAISLFGSGSIAKNTVRAQYIKNKQLVGYKSEKDIPKSSITETYAALRLGVNNWRWEGVPIYVRTGKRLPKKVSEITVVFKNPPAILFHKDQTQANTLRIRIQPEEGIAVRFNTKTPQIGLHIQPVEMDFCHECLFGDATPSGYETLLGDAIRGDRTLFTDWNELEASWILIDPIAKKWMRDRNGLEKYPAGSWGPKAADQLIEQDGRKWAV